MSDKQFLKGVRLETKQGQYGEYIKGSINIDEIYLNPVNEKYINFLLFKSKSGKWYAELQKPREEQVVTFNKVDEEEIPF